MYIYIYIYIIIFEENCKILKLKDPFLKKISMEK